MEKLKEIKSFQEYVKLALRTESNYSPLKEEVEKDIGLSHRIVHAVLGIETEIAEANIAFNKEDFVNYTEELGDIAWFLAIASDELGLVDDMDSILFERLEKTKKVKEFEDPGDLTEPILSAIKASMFYKKPFDKELAEKYILQIAWILYDAIAEFNSTYVDGKPVQEILAININKLSTRYPEKFDFGKAVNRDLEKEREVLEEYANKSDNY